MLRRRAWDSVDRPARGEPVGMQDDQTASNGYSNAWMLRAVEAPVPGIDIIRLVRRPSTMTPATLPTPEKRSACGGFDTRYRDGGAARCASRRECSRAVHVWPLSRWNRTAPTAASAASGPWPVRQRPAACGFPAWQRSRRRRRRLLQPWGGHDAPSPPSSAAGTSAAFPARRAPAPRSRAGPRGDIDEMRLPNHRAEPVAAFRR